VNAGSGVSNPNEKLIKREKKIKLRRK